MHIAAVSNLLPKLDGLIGGSKSTVRQDLKDDVGDIKREIEMILQVWPTNAEHTEIGQLWIREVEQLAYDVEDALDLHDVGREADGGFLRRAIQRRRSKDTRYGFNEAKQRLIKRAQDVVDRARASGGTPLAARRGASAPAEKHDLVGIEFPSREVLRLLQLGECNQLCVISIVGFRGLGKTTLAKVVYAGLDDGQFPCRAWVQASDINTGLQLLNEICKVIRNKTTIEAVDNLEQVAAELREDLEAMKRYFIVIDDMQIDEWDKIKPAFPDNGHIVITTTINSVAQKCSSRQEFVYQMRPLDARQSKKLFFTTLHGPSGTSPELENRYDSTVKKCDGLPLALVDFAQFLKLSSEKLTSRDHSNTSLSRMKEALTRSYNSLPCHDLCNCLLSLTMYPEVGNAIDRERSFKKGSLIRRWLAERLVKEGKEKMAEEYFEELINRNVIQPVEVRYSEEVKTCRVYGVMHDFILHKSVSENFVTLINDNKLLPNGDIARRLCIFNSSDEGCKIAMEVDLSHLRSLTISNHRGDKIVDLQGCKLLRVLVLENCMSLRNDILDDICELLHLRYLRLTRNKFSKVPRRISKLQYLETLDMRNMESQGIVLLPMEALTLPFLVNLFGRFELPSELKDSSLGRSIQNSFSEESKLETLAGFVVDKKLSFKHIMVQMSRLRKVKIWYAGTSDPGQDLKEALVSSLKSRVAEKLILDSFFIDLGPYQLDFLDAVNVRCIHRSMKLRGNFSSLQGFIMTQHSLVKLCISAVGVKNQDLSDLQALKLLLFLKLEGDAEDSFNTFSVTKDGFPKLKQLYFKAPTLPHISIAEGALQALTSLQLLSKDANDPSVKSFDIGDLQSLREVSLASSASEEIRARWTQEMEKHDNKPAIKYV